MIADLESGFWQALDTLFHESCIVIDRPKGSRHPHFKEIIYPLDYGYLQDTVSMDAHGIDVWRGSDPALKLDAVICTIDLRKKDSEVKLLLGCTENEKRIVMDFHNRGKYMKGLLIKRDTHG